MDLNKLDELYAKIPTNPTLDLGCRNMKAFVEEYGAQRMSDAFVHGLDKDAAKYMYGSPTDATQRIPHIEKSVCNQGKSIGGLVRQADQIISAMQKLEKRVVELEKNRAMPIRVECSTSVTDELAAEVKELREIVRKLSAEFTEETGILRKYAHSHVAGVECGYAPEFCAAKPEKPDEPEDDDDNELITHDWITLIGGVWKHTDWSTGVNIVRYDLIGRELIRSVEGTEHRFDEYGPHEGRWEFMGLRPRVRGHIRALISMATWF